MTSEQEDKGARQRDYVDHLFRRAALVGVAFMAFVAAVVAVTWLVSNL